MAGRWCLRQLYVIEEYQLPELKTEREVKEHQLGDPDGVVSIDVKLGSTAGGVPDAGVGEAAEPECVLPLCARAWATCCSRGLDRLAVRREPGRCPPAATHGNATGNTVMSAADLPAATASLWLSEHA